MTEDCSVPEANFCIAFFESQAVAIQSSFSDSQNSQKDTGLFLSLCSRLQLMTTDDNTITIYHL